MNGEECGQFKAHRLGVPHLPSWEVGTRRILLSRGKNAVVSMLIMNMCAWRLSRSLPIACAFNVHVRN